MQTIFRRNRKIDRWMMSVNSNDWKFWVNIVFDTCQHLKMIQFKHLKIVNTWKWSNFSTLFVNTWKWSNLINLATKQNPGDGLTWIQTLWSLRLKWNSKIKMKMEMRWRGLLALRKRQKIWILLPLWYLTMWHMEKWRGSTISN